MTARNASTQCATHMHVHDVQTNGLTNNPQWSPSEKIKTESDARPSGGHR